MFEIRNAEKGKEYGAMIEVGTLCLKIAGRDAGKRGVVLKIDKNKALIDGETRRRLVSLKHLVPVGNMDVKENAAHEEVVKAFSKIDVKLAETKKKEKKVQEQKVVSEAPKKKKRKEN